jgi:hypothetical protein
MPFSMQGSRGSKRMRLSARRGYSKADLYAHNKALMEQIQAERTAAAMEQGKRNAAIQALSRELRLPLWQRGLRWFRGLFGSRKRQG